MQRPGALKQKNSTSNVFQPKEKISHTLPKKLLLSLFDRGDNSVYPKKSIFQIKKPFLIISGKKYFSKHKKHFTCAKK